MSMWPAGSDPMFFSPRQSPGPEAQSLVFRLTVILALPPHLEDVIVNVENLHMREGIWALR